MARLEESIDDVTGKEQRLWKQFEVILDLEKPVNERRPNRLINLFLSVHVEIVNTPLLFLDQHRLLDLRAEFRHMENGIQSETILPLEGAEDLTVASLLEHLDLLLQGNLFEGLFICGSERRKLPLVRRQSTVDGVLGELALAAVLHVQHILFRTADYLSARGTLDRPQRLARQLVARPGRKHLHLVLLSVLVFFANHTGEICHLGRV